MVYMARAMSGMFRRAYASALPMIMGQMVIRRALCHGSFAVMVWRDLDLASRMRKVLVGMRRHMLVLRRCFWVRVALRLLAPICSMPVFMLTAVSMMI
jgi:hypothetical protein